MKEFFFVLIVALFWTAFAADPQFMIGVGKADITGPAADVNMMGFAHPDQRTSGIHTRLYSRAYITCEIADQDNCNVFVSADIAMGCTAINLDVFDQLRGLYGERYNEKNVVLSGTHTHSGPGGYLQYLTFTFTSLGFVNDSHDVIITGVVQSIANAHDNMVPGNVYVNRGDLFFSNINRSPTAYLNNPEEEKSKYLNNTDTRMTVAKFVDENDNGLGLISWFAVHPVSMNNTNHLISSDNKGYASYLAEKEFGSGFVAAFPNSNQGDVSPNLNGPKCVDTGEPCEMETSTCNGRAQLCYASGPGKDMFESTQIIGERQYTKAKELYDSATVIMSSTISSIHQFVDMSNYQVMLEDNTTIKTCLPALGYSFASGCTDGTGFFTFTQGDTDGSLVWDFVRDLIKEPSQEMIDCHQPKPVLLPTGEVSTPWQWHPDIVDTQILRIGELFILAAPGEFSTMAGRRLRNAIGTVLDDSGITDNQIVITGLSNTYTHYITTPEEYAIQRYEGASTIYGPNTMQAYIQQYSMLTDSLIQGTNIEAGPSPPNLLNVQRGLQVFTRGDNFPNGTSAGDVYIDVDPKYKQGSVVTAVFWAGNPRQNTLGMLEDTFLEVQVPGTPRWQTIFTDTDWSTRFYWETDHTGSTMSNRATIYWDIPEDQPLGMYRLRHSGFSKRLTVVLPYFGTSSEFEVVSKDYERPQ
ncbi:putative neutral ceramidase C isoform X1 [Lytechinus pictus]|uniref:putative neutral ceramidase C isoform X1 n=1 Tax=Lytechinus pictus TaxID=7653 RepID=UPI0030B9FB28